jgi:hypothetical protein
MKKHITGLADTLNVDETLTELLISDSQKQKVLIKASVASLVLSNCSEITVTVNAPVRELHLASCKKIEIAGEAPITNVTLEKCENTELHFNEENLFQSIETKETKGTTVCLPDACNMIPANKEGKVIRATPAPGGLQFA